MTDQLYRLIAILTGALLPAAGLAPLGYAVGAWGGSIANGLIGLALSFSVTFTAAALALAWFVAAATRSAQIDDEIAAGFAALVEA